MILKWFWIVVALTGILLFRNARYAVRQYFGDRNRVVLSLYLGFLILLGYLLLHITYRLLDFVQTAQETDVTNNPSYLGARLRQQSLALEKIDR